MQLTMADNNRYDRLLENLIKRVMDGQDDSNRKLEALSQKVEEGFKEVHNKQDYTNGKLLNAENDIRNLKGRVRGNNKITDKVDNKVLWMVGLALFLAVGGLAGTEVIKGLGELLGG